MTHTIWCLMRPCPVAGILATMTLAIAGISMPSTRAEPAMSACSRTPYKLLASAAAKFQVQLNWEVCSKAKNSYYQVNWKLANGSEQVVDLKEATVRSWTLTRARDESKYTFKVRGCEGAAGQGANCTPWSDAVTIKTPDWD